jgi:hypothetical protein
VLLEAKRQNEGDGEECGPIYRERKSTAAHDKCDNFFAIKYLLCQEALEGSLSCTARRRDDMHGGKIDRTIELRADIHESESFNLLAQRHKRPKLDRSMS